MQHLSNCLLAIPINIFLKNYNLKIYVIPTFNIYIFLFFFICEVWVFIRSINFSFQYSVEQV